MFTRVTSPPASLCLTGFVGVIQPGRHRAVKLR
jgi:hypothetical protein